jgi:hypothetical protein
VVGRVRVTMVADQGIKSINLYDIYANIVPGLVFVFGLLLPVDVVAVKNTVLGESVRVPFGVSFLLLLIAVSFVTGQILQVFGSSFDGDHGFNRLMWKIRGVDVSSRYDISDFDNRFWEMCRSEFQLTGGFENHDRLFKAILSHLEESGRERALRIQALYLYARGVYVATLLISILYLLLLTSMEFDILPESWYVFFRPEWFIVTSVAVVYTVSRIIDANRKGLEKDWIEYTVTESYLEFIEDE